MDGEYYRQILLKHWRLIILCCILGGAGAAIGSLFIAPKYQSTATLQLVIPSPDASLLSAASQTLRTEATLATSDSILSQVVGRYPGLTVEQLGSEVSAWAGSSTQILQITVTDHDPARAAHLANDLAAALIAQQTQAMQQLNAQSQQPILDALAATREKIDSDQATLASLQSAKPANQQEIQKIKNDLSALQKLYDQELQILADVQNAEARATSFLQVVGAAQPSSTPVHSTSWRLAIAAAGLGLGLLLGISLVLLRDRLDQQIRTTSALSALSGWPVLEELNMPLSRRRGSQSSTEQEETGQRGAYHLLSQDLAFLGLEAPLSSLAVTSTLPDSKAANVVAGDLALLLARGGKQVVLVDANFSRPALHRRFQIPFEPGLGAAVLAFSASSAAEKSVEPYLYPSSDVPGLLRVLPAGPIPPNPQHVVKSQAMKEVFRALGETGADVVLVGPPITGSADTCALAALADGVIVVIGRSHARKGKLMQVKRSLEEAGARVLGCVVYQEPVNQSQPIEQPGVVAGAPLS